jgi:hypothetical protein
MFCPQNVFMGILWISEQTAIISQESTGWRRSVFTARYELLSSCKVQVLVFDVI